MYGGGSVVEYNISPAGFLLIPSRQRSAGRLTREPEQRVRGEWRGIGWEAEGEILPGGAAYVPP